MLSPADLERERDEARRKWQLDYNTDMRVARMEGERIGMIHLCERLLHQPETPTEQLARLSLADLTRLADDLQAQVLVERTSKSS